MVLGFDY